MFVYLINNCAFADVVVWVFVSLVQYYSMIFQQSILKQWRHLSNALDVSVRLFTHTRNIPFFRPWM
jgi:hypothetical protein